MIKALFNTTNSIAVKSKVALLGICSCFAVSATIFTQNNHFELSYDYLAKVAQAVNDTSSGYFFSAPGLFDSDDNSESRLTLRHEDQSISISPQFSIFSEAADDKSDLFFSFHAGGVYRSPFLKAFLDIHAYTTQNSSTGSFKDFGYERFIRTDEHVPIEGFMDFRVNLPEAYLETSYKNITLQTGKRKLRWGPGYKGTLGLSGTSYSPFFFYHLQLKFGELMHLSSFLCTYDDPYYYKNEISIDTVFKVKNTNRGLTSLPSRYGAGQRLNVRLGKHVQLGIYELVSFYGVEDLTHFANPLQIYYLGNQASGTNGANLLGGMDFNVVVGKFRVYGEFLNDDITMFDDKGNPDKFALQLGTAYYPNSFISATGLEYTHVSPYVYGHSRVLSRHAIWGESLGWPYGNDQDVVTGYCLFNIRPDLKARAELSYWLKGKGTIESDWTADGKPDLDIAPYFPQNPRRIFTAYLSMEYHPKNWLSGSIVYRPALEEGKIDNGFQGMLGIGY